MNAPTHKTDTIKIATQAAEIDTVKELFIAYADWLGVDLCFQGFEKELATFPSVYDFLLLAGSPENPAGAVGLKKIDASLCEMKRLYVLPDAQGRGLGRALCSRLMDEARQRGYKSMALDTLERLEAAIALYESLGFRPCAPYYDNPEKDVVYMEKRL